MSADKPLSPEVAESPLAPEIAGEESDLKKNETAATPPSRSAAPADTPDAQETSSAIADAEAEPAAKDEAEAEAAPKAESEAGAGAETAPETLADGQPPLPPIPPTGATQDLAAEPENLPIQNESAPPATPDGEEEEEAEDRPMGLMDHLSELRSRLVRCTLAVMGGFIACWAVVDPIFDALVAPLLQVLPDGSHAIYTTLPEGFFTRMHIAFVAGVFVSSPLIFYQIWAFIAPGLYEEEKRSIIPVAVMSAIFFVSGGAFCYFIVFPNAFAFFMSYATDTIVAMPKISDYLSFVLKLILAFGLVFEMPLFAFFLARMGLITAELMRRVRRYAILAIFIVAAILSPPDVVSQLLMAAPMLFLYEVSILVAAGFGKKTAKNDGAEEKPEGEEDATAEKNPDKGEKTSEDA